MRDERGGLGQRQPGRARTWRGAHSGKVPRAHGRAWTPEQTAACGARLASLGRRPPRTRLRSGASYASRRIDEALTPAILEESRSHAVLAEDGSFRCRLATREGARAHSG